MLHRPETVEPPRCAPFPSVPQLPSVVALLSPTITNQMLVPNGAEVQRAVPDVPMLHAAPLTANDETVARLP